MLSVIVFREKHDSRAFLINSQEDEYKLALKIIEERLEWYDEEDKKVAKEILDNNNGKMAWSFVQHRGNYEYEGFEEFVLQDI